MTYDTIAELLAAKPELEKVARVRRLLLDWHSLGDAILEVANAVGTCGECAYWTPYPVQEAFGPRRGACYEEVVVFSEGDTADDFGCSLFTRRSQP